MRNALHEQIDGHDRDILVDLSSVHTADIVALRMLAFATRQAARQGRHVTLRGCCPAVRRLLHISRLIRVLEVERVAATA
ncbi:MAG: STAS domain-containing protein [Nocardioides sp.]